MFFFDNTAVPLTVLPGYRVMNYRYRLADSRINVYVRYYCVIANDGKR